MGATKKAGANAPATFDIEIDRDAAASWDAFKLLRILNDEEADGMAKMEAAIAYAGLVSGLDEDGIVALAGGGSAPISKVMDVVAQIIAEASPKN